MPIVGREYCKTGGAGGGRGKAKNEQAEQSVGTYEQLCEFGVELRRLGHGLRGRQRLQVQHAVLVDDTIGDFGRLVLLHGVVKKTAPNNQFALSCSHFQQVMFDPDQLRVDLIRFHFVCLFCRRFFYRK